MSDFDLELERAREQVARSRKTSKWTMLGLAFLSIVLIGAVAIAAWLANDNAHLAEANKAYGVEQQQEKQNLAVEGLGSVCTPSTDPKTPAEADFCQSLETAAAEPPAPMAGPQGVQGLQGVPGKDGAPGKDSTVPGPTGKDGAPGAPGLNGLDSTIPGPQGLDGAPGADSTVPGPTGQQGEPGPTGADGAPGTPPSSITFTDRTGTTYTCTPDPPGSSTYTCAATK